jgi:lysozyme family protein
MVDDQACRAIIADILSAEGGIADVGDGMGVTRYGQTDDWLANWSLPVPTSKAQAGDNYRAWMARTRLDELSGINIPLAHLVMDSAVNEGLSRAVRSLQGALGVAQDGVIGSITLNTLTHADPIRIGALVAESRLKHYVDLAVADPARNLGYLQGWVNRLWPQILAVTGMTF